MGTQQSSPHMISTTTFQHDVSPLKSTLRPGQNIMFTKTGGIPDAHQTIEKLADDDSIYQMPQPLNKPDQFQSIPREKAASGGG